MNRFRTITSIFLFVGFLAGLCGCEMVVNLLPDDKDDDPDEGLEIGLVVSLTGEYAGPYGFSMERGFNLARDENNNNPDSPFKIKFIVEDDTSTAEGMVNAFQRLVDAGVPAIVGIAISTHAKQAFPVAQENQVVTLSSVSAAAGLSSIGDYIFRTALATDKLNPAGVNATHAELGYERVAMIYDDADVYSTSSNEHLTAALLELGVEVATTQTFQTHDTDFTTQLTAIMELKPDALFISGLSPEMVHIMVQGREIGIKSQYIIPDLSVIEIELAGDAAEGVITFANWDIASDNPMNQTFVESYLTAYGTEPDRWAAQSYAAMSILNAAIANATSTSAGKAPDSAAIRDALAAVVDFDTILGSFSFDANGEAVYEPVVLTVVDGWLEVFGEAQCWTPDGDDAVASDDPLPTCPDDNGDGAISLDDYTIDDLPIVVVLPSVLESDPPQIHLLVLGELVDDCTTLHETTIEREGSTIFHINITTKRPIDMACAAVVTEIEHVVPLGVFDPGKYEFMVNDFPAVEVTID